MWLLFYVIDSLSVKLLQEGKQAIQRQPFLQNATITDVHADGYPSIGISQRVRKYLQQNATITDGFTDRFVDANTDGIFPSVICRSDILPTEIPTDRAISKVCELMRLWTCQITDGR